MNSRVHNRDQCKLTPNQSVTAEFPKQWGPFVLLAMVAALVTMLTLSGCVGSIGADALGVGTSKAVTSSTGTSTDLGITVSPNSATVTAGNTQQFVGTVTGSSNTAVTWSIGGSNCTGAACGTISTNGLYIPPATVSSPIAVVVNATSVANQTKSASASLTVMAAAAVMLSVSPTSASVLTASTVPITASVSGASNTAVTWSLSGAGCNGSACGTLSTSGLSAVYAAPAVPPTPASVTVVAASVVDPSASAAASVAIGANVSVSVTPTNVSLLAGSTQQFSATVAGTSNTTVAWSVSGTGCSVAACGTISSSGLYTAPSAVPSSSTVVATATSAADQTKTASANVTITTAASAGSAAPAGAATRDGITIPASHPAWYWNPAKQTTAAAWAAATGYTAQLTAPRPLDPQDMAFSCYAMSSAAACSDVVTWATTFAIDGCTGNGDDNQRAYGEEIFDAYDWAHSSFTSGQLATLASNWNTCMTHQDANVGDWGLYGASGTLSMPSNNYFWGDTRTDIIMGVATMQDNSSVGNARLDIGLGTNGAAYNSSRWNNVKNFDAGPTPQIDYFKNNTSGLNYGFDGYEGFGEYGRYMLDYSAQMLGSLSLLGRPLENEDTLYFSGVVAALYNTVYDTSFRGGYEYFPWSDDEDYVSGPTGCGYQSHNGYANHSSYTAGTGGCLMQSQYFGDFMQAVVNEVPTTNIAKLARTWLNTVKPSVSPIFASLDANPTPMALTALPLDYGTAFGYLWTRDNWNDLSAGAATQCLFQGNLSSIGTGHNHQDAGNFECYRHGIPIIRETVGYTETVAGYGGSGTTIVAAGLAHNVGLVNGAGSSSFQGCCVSNGLGTVLRRDSQPGYAYEATNIAAPYSNAHGNGNAEVSNYVREFFFFRGIPALLIVDRWMTNTATYSTTFSTHCLTSPTENTSGAYYTDSCTADGQEALYTSLVPAHPSQTIVNESANGATCATTPSSCQYRIESNNSPGNVLSYQIVAVQLGNSSGFSALTPSIVDSNSSNPALGTFTITLDANDSIVINKGATSIGGAIVAAGVPYTLSTVVESMAIDGSGPVWGAPTAP
jgi:hypothetical protein